MANSTTHTRAFAIYGAAHTVWLPFWKADGTSPAPTSLDTEVSLDGATMVDATNEVTLIKQPNGSDESALGYITFSAAEMTCDALAYWVKSANCIYAEGIIQPLRISAIYSGTATAGGNTTVTLPASAVNQADYYKGMCVRIESGTGAGQARIIDSQSGLVLTVQRAWEQNPSSDSVVTVGIPLSAPAQTANVETALEHRGYTANRAQKLDDLSPFNTVWVDPVSGNNTNAGTWASPLKTLQAAHDSALIRDGYGDEVRIKCTDTTGPKTVNDSVLVTKKRVAFRGAGAGFRWRVKNGYSFIFESAFALEVTDFWLDGALATNGYGVSTYNSTAGAKVARCRFTNWDYAAIDNGQSVVIDDCLFEDCGSETDNSGGTLWSAGNDGLIQNCRFVRCGSAAATAGVGAGVITIHSPGSGWIVRNNVFCDTGGAGIDVAFDAETTGNLACDNQHSGSSSIEDLGTGNRIIIPAATGDVTEALNAAIPGSPAADSINERVKALDDLLQASGDGDAMATLAAAETVAALVESGQFTEEALANTPSGGSGSEPAGFPVTVTCTIDGNPVLGALVTLQAEGGDIAYRTNSSGVARTSAGNLPTRPAGSYTLTVAGTGSYEDASGTVVVSATGVVTGNAVALTAISLPTPSSPDNYLIWGTEESLDGATRAAAGEVVVTVIDCSDDALYTADDGTLRRLKGTAFETDANGQWSFDIAKAAVADGGMLMLLRTFMDVDTDEVVGEFKSFAKMDVTAANDADQIAWAAWGPQETT